jgi:hypothetical protein
MAKTTRLEIVAAPSLRKLLLLTIISFATLFIAIANAASVHSSIDNGSSEPTSSSSGKLTPFMNASQLVLSGQLEIGDIVESKLIVKNVSNETSIELVGEIEYIYNI